MPGDSESRINTLESELSLLKNQVQQTLLDIREHVLEFTNPFTAEARLVRAWHERTAQAAQTNLTGSAVALGADFESLLDASPVEGDEAAPVAEPAAADFDTSASALFEDDPIPAEPAAATPELPVEEDAYDDSGVMDADFGETEVTEGYEPPQPEIELEEEFGEPAEVYEETEILPEPELEPEPSAEAEPVEETPRVMESSREPAPEPEPLRADPDMDLLRLSSLVRWVDQNTRRIGKDRVEVILDIYEMAGHITAETKGLVKRLCALDRDDDSRVPVREVVNAMLTIDGVLDEDASQSRRLLALMLDDPLDEMLMNGGGLPR